jgi:hypothetical protein
MVSLTWVLVAVCAALVGLRFAIRDAARASADMRAHREARREGKDDGWVAFLGHKDEGDIRITVLNIDPNTTLPEPWAESSPDVLYSVRHPNPTKLARQYWRELNYAHMRGEWYEREPTLMFIEYLKGGA